MKILEEYTNALDLKYRFHKQNLKTIGKHQINDIYQFLNTILNNPIDFHIQIFQIHLKHVYNLHLKYFYCLIN